MKEEEEALKLPEQDEKHEMHHMAEGHKTHRERHEGHTTADFKRRFIISL
jgi:hypothetical protein